MGESPKITDPLAALEQARRNFEEARGLHHRVRGGVRDPRPRRRWSMTPGFERLNEAARAPGRSATVAGELIRSEIEVKTGKCATSPRPSRRWPGGGGDLLELAEQLGFRLCGGRHPSLLALAGPAGHRHAALPHRRVDPALRGLAQQHVRAARPRRRCAAPTARSRSTTPCAPCCPSCWRCRQLALAGGPPHPPALDPHRDLHPRSSPAAGSPTASRLGRVRAVRALPDRDRLDPRAHRDLVERAPAPGLPDDRDADLRRPARVRPGGGAGGADGGALGRLRPPLRRRRAAARRTRRATSRRTCGGRSAGA